MRLVSWTSFWARLGGLGFGLAYRLKLTGRKRPVLFGERSVLSIRS